MGQSIFDYETKTFLSILAISLIGVAIVISQQQITSNTFFSGMLKKTPTNTFIIKNIELGSFIGKDIPVLSKNELKALEDGTITTNSGKTTYSQYILLQKQGDNGFDGANILFGKDNEGKTGNFLFFEKNSPLFEYAIVFASGLTSRIENSKLVDIDNKYLNVMGKSFVIVQTFVDVQQKVVKLRLMGSEGIIDFEDKNYGDGAYEKGVKVNGKQVEGLIKIVGFSSNNRFVISEIRYRPLAATRTSGDIYVSARQGVRGRLKNPSAIFVQSFEMIYSGISGGSSMQGIGGGEFVLFSPKGTTKYDLSFHNDLGVGYDIPLLTSSGSNFKYGSATKDLVFYEGNSNADYNIDRGDYFVVNNKNDINGVTNVIEYNGVDYASSTIHFMDVGIKDMKAVPFDSATGLGYLTASGNTYLFYVSSAANHPIVVDQNGDGAIDGGEAKIVLRGGGRLDLGSANVPGGSSATITLTTPRRLFAEPSSDEVVSFNVVRSSGNLDIVVPSQEQITMQHDKAGLDKGLTRFGVYFLRDGRSKTSAQLVIEYPKAVAFAMSTTAQGQGAVAVSLEREKYLRKQE